MISFNQAFDVVEAGFRSSVGLLGMDFKTKVGPSIKGYEHAWENPTMRRLARREMTLKGGAKGMGGAIFGRPVKGFSQASVGLKGFGYLLPFDMAISAATAPRGQMASAVAGSVAGTASSMAGTLIGGAVAGVPGAFVGGILGDYVGRSAVGKAVQKAADFGRNYHHLDFGTFRDSEAALTMRQQAARELGGSLMNARMYLGKEAMLMHQ